MDEQPIMSIILPDEHTGLPVMCDVLSVGPDGKINTCVIHRALPTRSDFGIMPSSIFVWRFLAPCGHAECALLHFEGCLN